jgi:hypothetical protein
MPVRLASSAARPCGSAESRAASGLCWGSSRSAATAVVAAAAARATAKIHVPLRTGQVSHAQAIAASSRRASHRPRLELTDTAAPLLIGPFVRRIRGVGPGATHGPAPAGIKRASGGRAARRQAARRLNGCLAATTVGGSVAPPVDAPSSAWRQECRSWTSCLSSRGRCTRRLVIRFREVVTSARLNVIDVIPARHRVTGAASAPGSRSSSRRPNSRACSSTSGG